MISVSVEEAITSVTEVDIDIIADTVPVPLNVDLEEPGIIPIDLTLDDVPATVDEISISASVQITTEDELPDRVVLIDDVGGGVTYVGKGVPGSTQSAAVWQIQKISEGQLFGAGDDLQTAWADGNANFDNIWDNRLTLSYT